MKDYLTPPEGWIYAAFPWHDKDEIAELPSLIQVGTVLLPEFFHLVIADKESWQDTPGHAGLSWGAGYVLLLNFQVFEEEVTLTEARTAWRDLPEVIERVRKVVPVKQWKSLGIHYITRYLTRFMEEGGRPEEDPMYNGAAVFEKNHRDINGYRPKAALQWLERLEDQASEAYATAREQPNPRKKRNRITDDFLRDVVKVYEGADRMGMPPTREVANHFKAPHSTAAKWVATARRKHMLPPADPTAAAQRLENKEVNRLLTKDVQDGTSS